MQHCRVFHGETQSRVRAQGFKPVDGTKSVASVGFVPSALSFIGTGKTLTVLEAGTLFLGINDHDTANNAASNAASNIGSYNVSIVCKPAP
jgi:hypothetical protein